MRYVFLVLAALVLAAPATAKDLTAAQVCGASGCAALPLDRKGDGLIQLRGSEGRAVVLAPRAAPYYRLNWEFSRRVRFTTLYVPSVDLIAAQGRAPGSMEWFGASESVLAKVRTGVRHLEPFAAPERWPVGLLAATPITDTAPTAASESRDWWGWIFGAAATLVLITSATFFARRLGIRRLRLSAR